MAWITNPVRYVFEDWIVQNSSISNDVAIIFSIKYLARIKKLKK
jgi:hypothetical protein